jgi:hypothetical protein
MNELTFYHFTADRFIKSIKKNGLIHGKLLTSLYPTIHHSARWQWLTTNSSFDQEWAIGTGSLPYKRNEVRITVTIPKHHKVNLKPWSQVKFIVPEVATLLSAYGDPENWWLYEGIILPKWLGEIIRDE